MLLLLGVWLSGAALFSLRPLVGAFQARRLIRRASRADDELIQLDSDLGFVRTGFA